MLAVDPRSNSAGDSFFCREALGPYSKHLNAPLSRCVEVGPFDELVVVPRP